MNRLEQLLKYLELDPDDTFTLYAVGLEYITLKENSKAIEYLESALTRDPDYLPAYQQLGHLFAITDRKSRAVETYNTGIQVAKKTGDKHAESNLRTFVEQLL